MGVTSVPIVNQINFIPIEETRFADEWPLVFGSIGNN